MGIEVAKEIGIVALPIVVFVVGARLMSWLSRHEIVTEQLNRNAAPADRKPLNQRLGYDVAAVNRYWRALDNSARAAERRALQLDLFFPFFYGAALATSLRLAWMLGERQLGLAWVLAPVALTVVSDWTENLVQLTQLRLAVGGVDVPMDAHWIRVASTATVSKLLWFVGSFLLIVVLLVWR